MGHMKDNAVSIVLPVASAEADALQCAFESLCEQTHENIEILMILNGADHATRETARRIILDDDRARILELEQSNLAAALNLGLRQSQHALVARMDADDWSHPQRIERQLERMVADTSIVALGTAYEIVDLDGMRFGVMTPPSNPAEARWRLLISNPFAHGSMMLRRDAVLALGGYDERFERAQDYELWVRLSGRGSRSGVCALPDVLYTLTRPEAHIAFGATAEQSVFAARVMACAWNSLAAGDASDLESLIGKIAQRTEATSAREALETRMSQSRPTMCDLLAWLWANWTTPTSSARTAEVARAARVREIARLMRARGVEAVVLWGAGTHTAWLLDHQVDLGIAIVGIVDDTLHGQQRFGRSIDHPNSIKPGQHVLLSSDWHEDALWNASKSAQARGVSIWRMYGEPICSTLTSRASKRSA